MSLCRVIDDARPRPEQPIHESSAYGENQDTRHPAVPLKRREPPINPEQRIEDPHSTEARIPHGKGHDEHAKVVDPADRTEEEGAVERKGE